MKTLYAEFEGTITMPTYFDRQQGCKKLLRTTKEPILTATMIHTSLRHFQCLPSAAAALAATSTATATAPMENGTTTTTKALN